MNDRIVLSTLPFNLHTINCLRRKFEYLDEVINIPVFELLQNLKGFGKSDATNFLLVLDWVKMRMEKGDNLNLYNKIN